MYATIIPSSVRLTRERLFFWVFLTIAANSLSGLAIRLSLDHGPTQALAQLFGFSAIIWVALAAAFAILREGGVQEASRTDWSVALFAFGVSLLPAANASAVAMSVVALYAIRSGGACSPLRRAGIIFLSISASLIWGRLLLAIFSRSLLFVDAFFVTTFTGASQIGNRIAFVGAPGGFVVAPGCSSLQGMSLAIVFWATVNQYYRVPTSLQSLKYCGLALLAAFVINILRLGSLAHFPAHFDAIHTGWGWHLASWITLLAIVACVMFGARRDVFSRP